MGVGGIDEDSDELYNKYREFQERYRGILEELFQFLTDKQEEWDSFLDKKDKSFLSLSICKYTSEFDRINQKYKGILEEEMEELNLELQ